MTQFNWRPAPFVSARWGTLALALALGTPLHAEYGQSFGAALAAGDFDNDGYFDVAVGAFGANFGGLYDVGEVNVLEGMLIGLNPTAAITFHQGYGGVGETGETGDHFGSTLVVGDFDHDGYDDLAVAASLEDRSGHTDSGVVQIFYGGASGLSSTGAQVWDQNVSGVVGDVNTDEQFGAAMAVGDFDHDGYDDLAIGAPHYPGSGATGTGEVSILYGSSSGLSATGSQRYDQANAGISGDSESGDHFGEALAAGDFDGDGYDDLAIGVPGEDLTGGADAGRVVILFGTSSGLNTTGSEGWNQDDSGVPGTAEVDDIFGAALTAGDFDGDGYDDLAIGAPGDSVDGATEAGFAVVLTGSSGGLTSSGSVGFSENTSGIPDVAEDYEFLGNSLAAGDFNNDGRVDLALGVPWETIGSEPLAGMAIEIPGSSSGLVASSSVAWHQDAAGVLGTARGPEGFAYAMSVADINNDGYDDLVVGVPTEWSDASDADGAIHFFPGTSTGLSATGDQFITW